MKNKKLLLATFISMLSVFITVFFLLEVVFENLPIEILSKIQDTKYILLGLITGFVAMIVSHLTTKYIIKSDETLAKISKINETDERNVLIRGKATSFAFIIGQILFCVLVLVFTLYNFFIPMVLTLIAFFIFTISWLVAITYYNKKL